MDVEYIEDSVEAPYQDHPPSFIQEGFEIDFENQWENIVATEREFHTENISVK